MRPRRGSRRAAPRPDGHRGLSPRTVDALFAGALLLVVGVPSALAVPSPDPGIGVVTSLLMPVALYWRRIRPVASAAVVHASALAHVVLGVPVTPADVLVLVALYSVTVHGPVWASRVALGSTLLGSALLPATLFLADPYGLVPAAVATFSLAAFSLFVWAMGLVRRNRVERVESLRERARRLEVERDQQAQIATAAERARIAREMHDVVAHSLSVVIAQADGGRYAAAADPDAAVRALATIGEIGRAALADMRRILGVLRTPDGEDASVTTPQPVAADLDALLAQVRATGLEVSVVRVGEERPLPAGAGLTVFRICQEALTNVLKHAGPAARVTVLLAWSDSRLVVQVDDDGRGAAATSDGAGQGLLGMRERSALFGGTLTAGPRPGGGFRVRAELPLPAASASTSAAEDQPPPSTAADPAGAGPPLDGWPPPSGPPTVPVATPPGLPAPEHPR